MCVLRRVSFFTGLVFLFSFLFVSIFEGASAQTELVWERFAAYSPDSDVVINHSPLTEMLEETVIPLGRAKSRLGPQGKSSTYIESHIKFGNNSPSRFEGNRLMIHAFTDDHAAFFVAYQEGLEWLSERRPLATLNRNEQLAYWLNLYNVIVINKLIEEYPVSKLKAMRLGGRGEESFWRQKVTTVGARHRTIA